MLVQNILDAYYRVQYDTLVNEGENVFIPTIGELVPMYRNVSPTVGKKSVAFKFKVNINPQLKKIMTDKIESDVDFKQKLRENKY